MSMTPKSDRRSTIRPETTPLYTTSVYTFPSLADVAQYYDQNPDGAYVYRRNGHPNEQPVEMWLAQLEGAEAATLSASGMAAISQACAAFVKPGQHIVASRHLYGGTYAMFEQFLRPFGVDIDYVDMGDLGQLEAALRANTALVFVETIANPLLQVTDLDALGDLLDRRGIPWFVDNTFATPWLVRPLQFGATLSIHSLTKYLNGHSDVIAGAVAGSQSAVERVRRFSVVFGGTVSPFDAWQTERGLQTFHLRFPAQCANAAQLAARLRTHPAIAEVVYPGLPNHPSHQIAQRILSGGFGAMVTLQLHGGLAAAETLVRRCQGIRFAPSLGGVSTTLSHPAFTSHRAYSPAQRAQLGITFGTIRISVGAEPMEDLESDLRQALDAVLAVDGAGGQA